MKSIKLYRRVKGSNCYPAGRQFAVAGVTIVDDEDSDLGNVEWRKQTNKRADGSYRYYAIRNDGSKVLLLHRLIAARMGLNGPYVDHINGDGLDNRRCNLRAATNQQNQANAAKRPGSSKFKGVYFHNGHRKWGAQLHTERRLLHLGYFLVEADAAKAYDQAAIKEFGEFARPNFQQD